MAEWNPDSTPVKGLQWLPHTESSVTLDAASKCACMSLVQTASQTIGTIRVWVGSIPTRGGTYVLEVFDNETAVPANVATVRFVPNEDVSGVGLTNGTWREDDGTTVTTIFSEISEAVLDTNSYIFTSTTAGLSFGATRYTGRFNSAAGTVTGKRILRVRHVVIGSSSVAAPKSIQFGLNLGGVDYFPSRVFVGPNSKSWPGDDIVSTLTTDYFFNPSTGRPWTAAEVELLDSTDEWFFSVALPVGQVFKLYQVYLEVTYCDENRIAVGLLDDGASQLDDDAWNAISMFTPAGVANFTKDGTGRHLYLLRRTSSAGALVVPTLAGDAVPPPASGFVPTLEPTFAYATAMGSAVPAVYGLIQRTTAPAESVDSQPYVDLLPALVYTGRDAEGEFSNAGASNYSVLRCLVQSNDASASLLVKIKRRSDDVQFGATVTITKAEADAVTDSGNGWRLVERILSSVAGLSAATQYYIEFSSAALGTGTDYWSVVALDTGDQGNGATFGGTTDRALVNGTEADRYDLTGTISVIPTAPANFAVAVADRTVPATVRGTTAVRYAHASWSTTALTTDFGQYELERTEDGGTTWVRIANVGTEATVTFDDHEAPRGVQCGYRVRVVRDDGAVSAWSSTVTATCSCVNDEMVFTSNQSPALSLAADYAKAIDHEFGDAAAAVLKEIYGRDGSVAFQPTERRLSTFDVRITTNAGSNPTVADGRGHFDALRVLSVAELPYVCILDSYGSRWFAKLLVPAGNHRRPGQIYSSGISGIELTQTPTVVEIA